MYDLTSVCNHSGSLSGGHFTATCRVRGCAGDDVWLDFNDMQVGFVSHLLLNPARICLFLTMSASNTSTPALNSMIINGYTCPDQFSLLRQIDCRLKMPQRHVCTPHMPTY